MLVDTGGTDRRQGDQFPPQFFDPRMHQGLHAADKFNRLLLGFAGDHFLAEGNDLLFEIHDGIVWKWAQIRMSEVLQYCITGKP